MGFKEEYILLETPGKHKIRIVCKVASIENRLISKVENKKMFEKSMGKEEIFIELIGNILLSELVNQDICPHVTINYFSEVAENKAIYGYDPKDKSKLCLLSYNEYINGETLYSWSKKKRSAKLWFNTIFQVMAGLHAIHSYFNITHTDLHADNIMCTKVKPGGYWLYRIDGIEYQVPNLGYIWHLIDYGRLWSPGLLEVKWYHKDRGEFDSKNRMYNDLAHVF